ncbi:hypothetical protein XM38_029980 [Halomicronema hongdechloris C2206]|uniref:Putative nickel insertion protein n=1 Tax=Halomicronema hongdechloris C2206 TaxID=1641165 RepID=A0A1Z3HP10_9CYAN|nr:hypothetical protein XM38_029980 [Halomicronema hongdechloris C2206]
MIGYLDCPTGISGDMCLGALVDAGVPLEMLQEQLHGLGLSDEFELRSHLVTRNGQAATRVEVDLNCQGPHRHLRDIEELIQQAQLPPQVRDRSLAIFRRLAAAEGAVHGIALEQVHFHEVGATDAIVDIVGTCLGLDWLQIDALYCSALPTGGGRVRAAHGWLPVPAPAVLQLMQMAQVPIYSNGIEAELVTPTGCAIATTLAQGFGPPPPLRLQRLGLGAGGRDLSLPNLLRLWLGPATLEPSQPSPTTTTPLSPAATPPSLETIAVLQTQVDDLSPQAIGYLFDQLLQAGALDVFTQAIAMKKNRPGVLITVICWPDQITTCETLLFQETTTLGIRRHWQHRHALQRQRVPVATPYGTVHMKLAWDGTTGTHYTAQPEYEDCAQLAQQHQRPWREIHRVALHCWHSQPEAATYLPSSSISISPSSSESSNDSSNDSSKSRSSSQAAASSRSNSSSDSDDSTDRRDSSRASV